MQMCYRGIKYNRNSVVPNLAQQQLPSTNGGMAQAKTVRTKFLGQVCQKKTISLAIAGKQTRFLGRISNVEFISPMVPETVR